MSKLDGKEEAPAEPRHGAQADSQPGAQVDSKTGTLHGGARVEIVARLEGIRERIRVAAQKAGRDPADVQLVAVSKFQPVESMQAALGAGQRIFGENYAQELREKFDALGGGGSAPVAAPIGEMDRANQTREAAPELHFLGALQTNKAKVVVGRAALIHTCDRLALAQELDKRAAALGVVQRVLIEVNLGGEAQKGGVDPAQLNALLDEVAKLSSLQCEGLMCIPPAEQDPRPHFQTLRRLRDEAKAAGHANVHELSMGMSADFEAAIAEGATLVRVGTAIFGERPAK